MLELGCAYVNELDFCERHLAPETARLRRASVEMDKFDGHQEVGASLQLGGEQLFRSRQTST